MKSLYRFTFVSCRFPAKVSSGECSKITGNSTDFPFSNKINTGYLRAVFFLLLFISSFTSHVKGQQSQNEAQWDDFGYSLKKVVSNTTIQTGVNFSYTIIYSAPAGATEIFIEDEVPAPLQIVSIPTPVTVNGVTPVISVNGQTVTYELSGLPAGSSSSGSFTIVVKFPAGVTCDGTSVRNRTGIRIDDKMYYTPHVSTTATAEDPWIINKTIWMNGKVSVNPNGGNCGYIVAPGDTVTYRLNVTKANGFFGNVAGQHNMSNAVVTDQLPPGAVFISSTCGVNPPLSGNTFTWQPNNGNLDASTPNASYACNITVYYPASVFPDGTSIYNEASLNGIICQQPVEHTSVQTCINVVTSTPHAGGRLYKYVYMTNRVPGCNGYYYIPFQNSGNIPLSPFTINDVIPSGITVHSVAVMGGNNTTTMSLTANNGQDVINSAINANWSSGPLGFPVNDLQLDMTGSLPAGNWIYLYIYFSVDQNAPGTPVENCATFDAKNNNITIGSACAQFTVGDYEPIPCVLKEICSPKESYDPGDIIRFRMRVQNIGSETMTGASLDDDLLSYFTYVGNETYYTANTYGVQCSGSSSIPPGTTAWSGVTTSHSNNNLSWSLPDIDSDCQLFYSTSCGYYGTTSLPYYYIEFDVRIDSLAPAGISTNSFEVSGGNVPAPVTSNSVNILITPKYGQQAFKEVSGDNGSTFGTTANVNVGGTARYRLNYRNLSNVPLTEVKFVDLLPRNDGTNDLLVLDRNISRGSQIGVGYVNTSTHATTLQPAGTAPSPAITFAAGQNICLPEYNVNIGCNQTTWGSQPDSNVKMDYGNFFLPIGVILQESFNVQVPASATPGQNACNDFAVIATANFILDGTQQTVSLTPIAAPPVCLTVKDGPATGECCEGLQIEKIQDPAVGNCCLHIATKCEVDSIRLVVDNGTFSTASWNCHDIPDDYTGQNIYTFKADGCAVDMITCVNADVSGTVTIGYTVYFANGEVCEGREQMDCKATPPSSSDCCPIFDFKLNRIWPRFGNYEGTFTFLNPDPSNPICEIKINASPATSFTTGQLIVDGVQSNQSWNDSSIPASGTLIPPAENSVVFTMTKYNYDGNLNICVIKCDGTECCYEVRWKGKGIIIIDTDVSFDLSVLGKKLYAVSLKPEISTKEDVLIKYVSFGEENEQAREEDEGRTEIFAAGISGGSCDNSDGAVNLSATWTGRRNAFFELACPFDPKKPDQTPAFNLVFSGKQPEIGCTMFDTEGNEIFSGKIEMSLNDTVTSASINPLYGEGSMLELINLYPNPANSSFKITYATAERGDVEIRLVNQLGQVLRIERPTPGFAGVHTLDMNTNGIAAGMYHVQLISGERMKTRKVVIDK